MTRIQAEARLAVARLEMARAVEAVREKRRALEIAEAIAQAVRGQTSEERR